MANMDYIKVVVIGLVLIASAITIENELEYRLGVGIWDDESYYDDSYDDDGEDVSFKDDSCNVAGVILHGDLYTYGVDDPESPSDSTSAENLIYHLEQAEQLSNIDVILLEIDSYGGSPVAAEEVVATLQNYVTKPVVAQIREGAASAAYWIASASDVIFASALSDVGSIGVTASYLDEHELNLKEGYTFNQINTGKFKDTGNIEKPLTQEERALFQRDVDIIFEAFLKSVAENRGMEIDRVRALADGSTMLGEMAKENKLIDEIGGIYEVLDYIEANYDIDPVICW